LFFSSSVYRWSSAPPNNWAVPDSNTYFFSLASGFFFLNSPFAFSFNDFFGILLFYTSISLATGAGFAFFSLALSLVQSFSSVLRLAITMALNSLIPVLYIKRIMMMKTARRTSPYRNSYGLVISAEGKAVANGV
jgi:hypothetical protein